MEIFFDLLGRGGGAEAEQFVVSGFAGEVEQGADFFFEFFGVERVFGDARVLREWFSQLLLYSEVATIVGSYFDFSTIAGATLEMTSESRKVTLSSSDREQILEAMLSLPPHKDVHEALKLLADAGLQLVTLTNSNQRAMKEQLKNAGIDR